MRFLQALNAFVFLSATILVMSIFYEGATLEWYAFVPILMIITDVSFIAATILHLLINRKVKLLLCFNVFSALLIGIVIIMKILSIPYPQWGLVLWNFYILYFYGTQMLIHVYKHTRSRMKD